MGLHEELTDQLWFLYLLCTYLSVRTFLLNAVGDAGAGVWGIGGSRVLRVCRHDVLTPQSAAEGGGESVKDRASGQWHFV